MRVVDSGKERSTVSHRMMLSNNSIQLILRARDTDDPTGLRGISMGERLGKRSKFIRWIEEEWRCETVPSPLASQRSLLRRSQISSSPVARKQMVQSEIQQYAQHINYTRGAPGNEYTADGQAGGKRAEMKQFLFFLHS